MPACPPGRRPVFFRSDFGAGFASPSDLGGFAEFRDVFATRGSNSAIRARACSNSARDRAIRPARSTTSAASSSYDGTGDAGDAGGSSDAPGPCDPINRATPTPQDHQAIKESPPAGEPKTNDLRELTGTTSPGTRLDVEPYKFELRIG